MSYLFNHLMIKNNSYLFNSKKSHLIKIQILNLFSKIHQKNNHNQTQIFKIKVDFNYLKIKSLHK